MSRFICGKCGWKGAALVPVLSWRSDADQTRGYQIMGCPGCYEIAIKGETILESGDDAEFPDILEGGRDVKT